MGQQHGGWQGYQNQPPSYWPPQPPPNQSPYRPRRPKRKLWQWLVPALAVVVAAAIVVTIVLSQSSPDAAPAETRPSDDRPSAEPAARDWKVKLNRPDNEKGLGAWEGDEAVVVAHEGAVTSFAKRDGRQLWRTTPPGGSGKFCGAATRVVEDQVAIAYGKELDTQRDAVCAFATVLNVRTGQLGWEQPMNVPQRDSAEQTRKGAALEIMGDVVVIGQDQGTAGLELSTGKQRWAKPVVKPTGDDQGASSILGMRPGKQSLVVSIAGYLSDPAITFALLDPATGTLGNAVDYSAKSGERFTNPRLVAADPPVAVVSRGQGAVLLVMDEKFAKVGVIEAGPAGSPDSIQLDGVGVDAVDNRQPGSRILMSGGLLVTVTSIPMNGTNKLVAYDIKSGTRKWAQSVPDGRVIMPLALDGDAVVALVSPAGSQGGDQRIARFALADGAPGAVAAYELASDHGGSTTTEQFRYFWRDERLWAVRGQSNKYGMDAFSIGK